MIEFQGYKRQPQAGLPTSSTIHRHRITDTHTLPYNQHRIKGSEANRITAHSDNRPVFPYTMLPHRTFGSSTMLQIMGEKGLVVK